MGKKWGSNEDIHIGDIFSSFAGRDRPTYYQVTALRGSTQVVLRAIEEESFIQEGISEGSPLYRQRERTRPLPGKFMPEVGYRELRYRGKLICFFVETVTAWVRPDRMDDGSPVLQEVGHSGWQEGVTYDLVRPEDYETWTPEQIKLLEKYEIAWSERARKMWLEGDKDSPWPEYPM